MTRAISACLIVKNEEKNIENCLLSIRQFVDEIVIVDTGSTDNTYKICEKYADIIEVYTCCNDENGCIADFSNARQRSFDLATNETVLWIDGDDVVSGCERIKLIVDKIKENNDNPFMVMLPYEYSYDNFGNVTCLHKRERIIYPKSQFKWRYPVHEVLSPPANVKVYDVSDIVIKHKREECGKKIEDRRNIRILEKYHNTHGSTDSRHMYYLGVEYSYYGMDNEAIELLDEYVSVSKWDDEKFLALMKLSEIYQSRSDFDRQIEYCMKAVSIKPEWGEGYFALSRAFYFKSKESDKNRNLEKCVYFARLGLSQKPTETILFVNKKDRDSEIHKYLNVALSELGDMKGALESVECGIKFEPNDEIFVRNRKIYTNYLSRQAISYELAKLVEIGSLSPGNSNEIKFTLNNNKLRSECCDTWISNTKFLGKSKTKKSIVFYIGFNPQVWDPEVVEKFGMGGSEIAVVEVSKRLAEMGNDVIVYANCGNDGVFDNVKWVDINKFDGVTCDVFISSRKTHCFDSKYRVSSKINIAWSHDVMLHDLVHMRYLQVDKIFALSNWHKKFMLNNNRCIIDDTVYVTSNGVDLERFKFKEKRNPHKAVYSSSPDRGLEELLLMWPYIKKEVSNAELHILYGFDGWDGYARASGDTELSKRITNLKNLIVDSAKFDVVFHGKKDQKTLAKHFLTSGVMLYPTDFTETSCITAMEAQLAGCQIVTSPLAALNETASDSVFINGQYKSDEYRKEFILKSVEAMTKTNDIDRCTIRDNAVQRFSWDYVANDWDTKFDEWIAYKSENPIKKYKGII